MIARRWFHLTPDRFVIGLLVVEGLLWLSESFHLFAKGWAVLTAIGSVGAAALLLLVWFAASLIFRRQFQFSIRTMFSLVLAVAVPCDWLAVERERARRQTETVAWIVEHHGSVRYDWELEVDGRAQSSIRSDAQPPGPAWLSSLLGSDFFAEIGDVNLTDSQFADVGLIQLEGLTHLNYLWIDNTNVTDGGLEHLKGLAQLQVLDLVGTKVTDSGLKHLQGLAELRGLGLNGTQVTDVGLEHLQGLSKLRNLQLEHTRVTDKGLESLKGLTQLEVLTLDFTQVTDAGLEHLRGMTQLYELGLIGAQVTDDAVRKLLRTFPNCAIHH